MTFGTGGRSEYGWTNTFHDNYNGLATGLGTDSLLPPNAIVMCLLDGAVISLRSDYRLACRFQKAMAFIQPNGYILTVCLLLHVSFIQFTFALVQNNDTDCLHRTFADAFEQNQRLQDVAFKESTVSVPQATRLSWIYPRFH